MKKLNMFFLLGVLVISLLSLSSLAASNCSDGGKIKVTLVSAQANLVSDIYLKEPSSVLLFQNSLANVGRTAEVAYAGTASLVFSILVHGANGTYEHFSNSRYARTIMPTIMPIDDANSYYTIAFEDDPSNNSDWDYNDVVLKIEIKKNTCAQETTCTDADSGKNYYLKGSVTGLTGIGQPVTDVDHCLVSGVPQEDIGKLGEYYCCNGGICLESYTCPNGCSNGACIQTQSQAVTFEVGVNNYQRGVTYPEGHNEALSRNIPYAFVNVYGTRVLGNNQYQGTLKATLNTGSRAYAEVTVQPGEMVDFVGFKDETLARSYTTWTFTTPSYKNFGSNPDQLCQINFNDPNNYLNFNSGYACANSLSTPYYSEGAVSVPSTPTAVCKTFSNILEGETLKFNQGASTVSQVISQGGFFSLGNYQLQYKGADSITKENPKIKFKELGSGDTLEYSLGVKGEKAEFSIKLGGKAYYFESASDIRVDNFKIVLLSGSTSSNNQKEITLVYTDSAPVAKFEVNGESTDKLRRGQSYTLMDGSVLTVEEVIFQSYAGGIHSAQFCINGEKVTKTTETPIEPTPITLEADLVNYPKIFITGGKFNGYFVVGERSPAIDNLAGMDIAVNGDYEVVDAFKLDAELPNPFVRNLIVIGRPEENQIAKMLTGVNQASDLLKPGEAMIKLYTNKGFAQLLVMGYSTEDTRKAAKVLRDYKKYGLKGNQVIITGTFPNVQIISGTVTTPAIPQTEPTTPAIPTTTEPSTPATPRTEPLPSICNIGCKVNGNCLPYGTRLVQDNLAKFCDINQQLGSQKELGASCQNNYECFSNQCSNSKCIDLSGQIQQTQNFIEKIWSWVTRFFGVKN